MIVAALPRPNTSGDGIPEELQTVLSELESWALANRRDARRDFAHFWMLKTPAIFASASAGIWDHFGLTGVGVVSGAIASLCVIMDGVQPKGQMRNTHMRAYHEIRRLESKLVDQWRLRSRDVSAQDTVNKIIRAAIPERERIAKYVEQVETALTSTIEAAQ
jgi:hypothetical protein